MRRGPVAPTAAALGILRALPLDAVHLEPRSVLGGWQVRNRDATIPHALDRLESSGALANLRRVLTGEGDFAGEVFADSDVHKTLEAMGWDAGRAAQDPDGRPAWAQEATALVDLLEQVQDEDGYLGSWCQGPGGGEPWADLRRGHEMYCAGHLIQAGVAWARTTGDTRLLTVARRFADLLVRRFGAGAAEAVCGHPQIETALVELFRTTGERTYLDLARRMIDLRGRGLLAGDQFGDRYLLDHTPVRELTQATGHAVRMLYLATGATDVAVEDRDEALLATMQRLWQDAFGTKTYITGGQGSRHRDESFGDAYELPSDRAYAETCAAIAAFHWSWRLLLATGDPRYADAMEHLLHNAIAVATAEDGRHFFYSNPLQLRPEHDGSQEDAPSQ
ncbi:MAG TPA: beta-L-arabinofuranosidase domain-containing protein, partial [Friedmanniella sp.]